MTIYYLDGTHEEVNTIEVNCINPDLIIVNKMESRKREDIMIITNTTEREE